MMWFEKNLKIISKIDEETRSFLKITIFNIYNITDHLEWMNVQTEFGNRNKK